MAWQWVDDLLAPVGRKKIYTSARCPYAFCPSIDVPEGEEQMKPKLKFVQKVSPYVLQFRCGYCGCLSNHCVEFFEGNNWQGRMNPVLWGGKNDWRFHV